MLFEGGAQTRQDLHRVLDRRLVDVDLLEAAEEGAILFEVVAELLVGGRADAADRAAGQSRLQEVRSIHRTAAGRAGADHRVDLVDEENGVRHLFELGDDRLQPFLEIAPVARSGEQGAHVERVDHRFLQHIGDIALDDLARQTFRDGRFADPRVAYVERVVFRAAAQDLHGSIDFGPTADQRIDAAVQRLLVQIDGELLQGRFALLLPFFLLGFFGSLDLRRLRRSLALADAVADIAHRIQAAHVLLLEEVDGIAFALGEERNKDVRASHFVAARRLDVKDRALNHALEAAGR